MTTINTEVTGAQKPPLKQRKRKKQQQASIGTQEMLDAQELARSQVSFNTNAFRNSQVSLAKSKSADLTRDIIDDKNKELDQFERDLDSILNESDAKNRADGHMMIQQESSEEEDDNKVV